MLNRFIAFTLSSLLLSCQGQSVPFNLRASQSLFQAQKKAASGRNPLPLIQQFHSSLQGRNPELLKLKYEAMQESPFVFYRATAFLFYNDLKTQTALNTAPQVPLQGDFHLENMGTYIGSNGAMGYDLNDFDEAITGPNSWDLARLAVSIHLAADETGFNFEERQQLIAHFLKAYLAQVQNLQKQPALLQQILDERYLDEKAGKQVLEARERFSRPAWLAEMTNGKRFILNDKVRPVQAAEAQMVQAALNQYVASRREGAGFYAIKDIASRIAGKGSLGRYRYIVLIEGRSASAQDDLILEIKEAITPSAAYAGSPRSRNEATRIVQAYKSTIPGSDPMLGVSSFNAPDGQFSAYVRELLPKETVNLEKVNKFKEYQGFLNSCALIIARMHSRTGQSAAILQKTPIAAIQSFADDYAEVVAGDWTMFRSSR